MIGVDFGSSAGSLKISAEIDGIFQFFEVFAGKMLPFSKLGPATKSSSELKVSNREFALQFSSDNTSQSRIQSDRIIIEASM